MISIFCFPPFSKNLISTCTPLNLTLFLLHYEFELDIQVKGGWNKFVTKSHFCMERTFKSTTILITAPINLTLFLLHYELVIKVNGGVKIWLKDYLLASTPINCSLFLSQFEKLHKKRFYNRTRTKVFHENGSQSCNNKVLKWKKITKILNNI